MTEHVTAPPAPLDVLEEVRKERQRQDAKWGGPEHDDTHSRNDWWRYIHEHNAEAYCAETPPEHRKRLIEVAALAVAAIESHDRIVADGDR